MKLREIVLFFAGLDPSQPPRLWNGGSYTQYQFLYSKAHEAFARIYSAEPRPGEFPIEDFNTEAADIFAAPDKNIWGGVQMRVVTEEEFAAREKRLKEEREAAAKAIEEHQEELKRTRQQKAEAAEAERLLVEGGAPSRPLPRGKARRHAPTPVTEPLPRPNGGTPAGVAALDESLAGAEA